MAIKVLPVKSDFPSYDFSIELDGNIYILGFRFNTRLNTWMMSISGEDGTELLKNIPIHTYSDITAQYVDSALPQGIFLAYDTEGELANAGRNDLGNRVQLLYQEAA